MSRCRRPPTGWYCKSQPDHEGPCPAWPRWWAHPIWWLRCLGVGLLAALMVACASPVSLAPANRASCADVYVKATTGHQAKGVIACLAADQQASWNSAGIASDDQFSQKVGAWSGMSSAHFVGTDGANRLYVLSGKSGHHMIVWVALDDQGRVAGSDYIRYDR